MMIKLLAWGSGLAGALLSALATIMLAWLIFGRLATKMLARELQGKKRPVRVDNDTCKREHIHYH